MPCAETAVNRQRLFSATALAILVFVLFLPAAADAAVPASGGWAGTGPDLTFTVGSGGTQMTDFTAPTYPVYCFAGGSGNGQATTRIFTIPSVAIDPSGSFDTVYHPADSAGNAYGTLEVSGQFTTPNTVSGKLNYSRDGCYGGADFTATRQNSAPGPSTGGGTNVTLALPRNQHVLAAREIKATVSCAAECVMGASAKVKIGSSRSFELKSSVTHLTQAGSQTVVLMLSAVQVNAIREALKRHRQVVATVIADAGALDGTTSESKGVKLTIRS